MTRPVRLFVAALVVTALTAAVSAMAQQHDKHEHGETPAAAVFRPGLGDLMTAFVQPRHTKLGLARIEGNWAYAAYELHELQGSFDKVARLVPKHGKLAVPDAIASTVKPAMAALGEAIKGKDQPAFTKAYADLTAGCNACHQSGDHAMIVIQVPTVAGAAFPDQDFRAPK